MSGEYVRTYAVRTGYVRGTYGVRTRYVRGTYGDKIFIKEQISMFYAARVPNSEMKGFAIDTSGVSVFTARVP